MDIPKPGAHLTRFLALAWVVLALAAALPAQSLQPTSENGRIVWTNDGPSHPARCHRKPAVSNGSCSTGATPNSAGSRFVPHRQGHALGSRHRRTRYPTTLSRAPAWIQAAAKVKGKLAAQDPNYSRAAGNRSVSAAEIDRYINEAAARHHVDPNLVRALVKVESNFNPRAVSSKGAMGLMQLMPETARMYDVRNPFDAAQNVEAGVRHLKGLLENYGGDVSLSLAAYNAGQGAVERNGGIPPYTETRNYVKRITNLMGSGSELALQQSADPHSGQPR